MFADLRKRGNWRDHLFSIGRMTVPTLIIFITAMSCSDMREPRYRVVERELVPSGRLLGEENRQLVRPRVDRQAVLAWDPSKTSVAPKVAKVHAPARTGAPASGRISENANTPPLLDAEKEQLFREFLEWRKRQIEVR